MPKLKAPKTTPAPTRRAWVELVPAALSNFDPYAKMGMLIGPMGRCWTNGRYAVQVEEMGCIAPFGRVKHLAIKINQGPHDRDWQEFMRIKDQLAGPEWNAIEFYPRRSAIVDQADMYHLWCWQGYDLPLMWNAVIGPDFPPTLPAER